MAEPHLFLRREGADPPREFERSFKKWIAFQITNTAAVGQESNWSPCAPVNATERLTTMDETGRLRD